MDPAASFIQQVPEPNSYTLWENKEYGIRAASEFTNIDTRTFPQIVSNYAGALIHGAGYTIESGYKRFTAALTSAQPQCLPLVKSSNCALAVFLHGLYGQSSLWNAHIELLKTKIAADIYAPELPDGGACSVDDPRIEIIVKRIVDWTIDNPDKKIALIAQSRGTCIALRIEYLMRKRAPSTPVHVSMTGAVLFGSKTIEITSFNNIRAALPGYNIYDDLCYGSEASKTLLRNARLPLANNEAARDYVLIAPYHDYHVNSLGSALPILCPHTQSHKTETHYIIYDRGHNAAPLGAKDLQIDLCVTWLNKP